MSLLKAIYRKPLLVYVGLNWNHLSLHSSLLSSSRTKSALHTFISTKVLSVKLRQDDSLRGIEMGKCLSFTSGIVAMMKVVNIAKNSDL